MAEQGIGYPQVKLSPEELRALPTIAVCTSENCPELVELLWGDRKVSYRLELKIEQTGSRPKSGRRYWICTHFQPEARDTEMLASMGWETGRIVEEYYADVDARRIIKECFPGFDADRLGDWQSCSYHIYTDDEFRQRPCEEYVRKLTNEYATLPSPYSRHSTPETERRWREIRAEFEELDNRNPGRKRPWEIPLRRKAGWTPPRTE